MRTLPRSFLALACVVGCAFDPAGVPDRDRGVDAQVASDAGPVDAAPGVDASPGVDAAPPPIDGGPPPIDAAPTIDAQPEVDAFVPPPYVAYWSFDVDATDATGAHHGTLEGSAAITSGDQGFGGGEALQLFADGDRVDVANPTTLDFNSDFTWHALIKTGDGSGAILSRNPLAGAWNQGSKALFVRNRSVQFDTGWVGNPSTGVVVDDDEWHQVIVVFTAATDQLRIFVDPSGGDAADYDGTHEVDRFDEHTHVHNGGVADTGFSIGQANFTGGLSNLDTLVGLIDEVAIFPSALTGAELDQLITMGPRSF